MPATLPTKTPTQFQALREIGHIQAIDFFVGTFAMVSAAVFLITPLFVHLSVEKLFWMACACFGVLHIWTISLIFRCSFFVIQVWASMKLLPEDAARLAIAFQRGQSPPNGPNG